MSVGDRPAFPVPQLGDSMFGEGGLTTYQYPGSSGMTYRQWLVGQVLCGMWGDPELAWTRDQMAEQALDQADAVIKWMDIEEQGARKLSSTTDPR